MTWSKNLICIYSLAWLLVIVHWANADVTQVNLERDYADFVLNPESGDLVAVDHDRNSVFLLGKTAASAKNDFVAKAKVPVGSGPCAIIYKRFADVAVYAVVCSQDSSLYLINAKGSDPDSFKLLKKIPLNIGAASSLAGSRNPEDPYVYYCYGGGHDSKAGVINLRTMTDEGEVLDSTMDCAVSASGECVYRRGPWSPSGFESLLRVGSFDKAKPEFTQIFRDHAGADIYLPDPFDQYTVNGTRVFNRSLTHQEAELEFRPLCFSITQPFMFGIATSDPSASLRVAQAKAGSVVLLAASSNHYKTVGRRVPIDDAIMTGDRNLPRINAHADFKIVAKQTRLFADDRSQQLVLVSGNRLTIVPLADFELPDEPHLLVRLDASKPLIVNRPNVVNILKADKRVELSIEDLPAGAVLENGQLKWQPEEIGTFTLTASTKFGEIDRTQRLEVKVIYPSIKLPFAVDGAALDSSGNQAVIWNTPMPRNQMGSAAASESTLAILDLTTGKIVAQKRMAEPWRSVVLMDKRLIAVSSQEQSTQCEVLTRDELKRVSTLTFDSPVRSLHTTDKLLLVQCAQSIDAFDLNTLKKLKSFGQSLAPRAFNQGEPTISQQGIFYNHVLYGFDLRPNLITEAFNVPTFEHDRSIDNKADLMVPLVDPRSRMMHGNPSEDLFVNRKLPDENTEITLRRKVRIVAPSRLGFPRREIELSVHVSGQSNYDQILFRGFIDSPIRYGGNQAPPAPTLTISGRNLFVFFDNDVYKVNLPKSEPVAESTSSDSGKPKWVMSQSALEIDKNAPTVLKHKIVGSKSPMTFSLIRPLKGMEIDESTGTVTLDREALMKEVDVLLDRIIQERYATDSPAALQNFIAQTQDAVSTMLGRKLDGLPFAIPILVRGANEESIDTRLRYYVFAEIPVKVLMDKYEQIRQRNAKAMEQATAMRAAQAEKAAAAGRANSNDPNDNPNELKRRIQSLENRIENMEALLREISRKLDKQ